MWLIMAPPFWWEYINTDILTDSREKVNLFLVTLQTLYEYGSSPTRLARSAPASPGSNVINLRSLFQHAQKLVIEFIDNASAR